MIQHIGASAPRPGALQLPCTSVPGAHVEIDAIACVGPA